MTIRKATFTYTFMFDDTVNSVEEVQEMSLGEILEHCDTEHMLGRWSGVDDVVMSLPDESVPYWEVSLGGDGTFFMDPDELQHAILDRKYRTLPETTLFDLCEQKGIQLVEADEEEIRGRWDWLDGHGNASDASLDTKRAAAIDALVTLDEGEDDGTSGQDRDSYSDTQDRSNYSVDE